MKRLINKILGNVQLAGMCAKDRLKNRDGDFVLDHAMVFVIILVVGAVAIVALVTYIENDFTDLIQNQINDFFN